MGELGTRADPEFAVDVPEVEFDGLMLIANSRATALLAVPVPTATAIRRSCAMSDARETGRPSPSVATSASLRVPLDCREVSSAARPPDCHTFLVDTTARRPHMPGYGVEPADRGRLLPWSWAQERIAGSHDYWLATTHPSGRPHVMPVWGVLLDGGILCSTSPASRKARNLIVTPGVAITTDDPTEPVIVEGTATIVTGQDAIARFAAAMDAKYEADHGIGFYEANTTIRIEPVRVFGLETNDFTGTPTRWTFESPLL